MPAFTPNLNLYKPGGGSTGLITPDEVVDVDRLNVNSDIIDSSVKALQDRAAALEAQGGMRLVRPSAVFGPGSSLLPDGTVDVGTGTSVRLDGVFTNEFEVYKITGFLTFATATNSVLEFSALGSVLTGGDKYTTAGVGVNNSTSVIGYRSIDSGNIQILNPACNQHFFEITVVNPAASGRRTQVIVRATGQHVTTQISSYSGGGGTQVTDALDGFRINPGTPFTGGRVSVFAVSGAAL